MKVLDGRPVHRPERTWPVRPREGPIVWPRRHRNRAGVRRRLLATHPETAATRRVYAGTLAALGVLSGP